MQRTRGPNGSYPCLSLCHARQVPAERGLSVSCQFSLPLRVQCQQHSGDLIHAGAVGEGSTATGVL